MKCWQCWKRSFDTGGSLMVVTQRSVLGPILLKFSVMNLAKKNEGYGDTRWRGIANNNKKKSHCREKLKWSEEKRNRGGGGVEYGLQHYLLEDLVANLSELNVGSHRGKWLKKMTCLIYEAQLYQETGTSFLSCISIYLRASAASTFPLHVFQFQLFSCLDPSQMRVCLWADHRTTINNTSVKRIKKKKIRMYYVSYFQWTHRIMCALIEAVGNPW